MKNYKVCKLKNSHKGKMEAIRMNSKLYLLAFMFILFLLPILSATEQSLGTYKQNTCINLKQTCSNCTYVNITSILAPNSNKILDQVTMEKSGTDYNYTICTTGLIGTYTYNTLGDINGVATVQPVTFEVTPSGFGDSLGFYFIMILLCGGVITLGFLVKDGWFVIFGGVALMVLGIYSVNNGIAGYRDMMLTWAVAIFEIGTGAYLSINSALEMMDIDLGGGGL